MTYDMDWKSAFENSPELHKHIESLSNEYCRRSIEFMKNIHVGEVFLSKDLLQDNAAMLIRNTDKLNKLMQRFNMEHTTGSLIPLF